MLNKSVFFIIDKYLNFSLFIHCKSITIPSLRRLILSNEGTRDRRPHKNVWSGQWDNNNHQRSNWIVEGNTLAGLVSCLDRMWLFCGTTITRASRRSSIHLHSGLPCLLVILWIQGCLCLVLAQVGIRANHNRRPKLEHKARCSGLWKGQNFLSRKREKYANGWRKSPILCSVLF